MPYVTVIILLIIILGEHPATVCCGWTSGRVIKNQPEKMKENCTLLIIARPRFNASLIYAGFSSPGAFNQENTVHPTS